MATLVASSCLSISQVDRLQKNLNFVFDHVDCVSSNRVFPVTHQSHFSPSHIPSRSPLSLVPTPLKSSIPAMSSTPHCVLPVFPVSNYIPTCTSSAAGCHHASNNYSEVSQMVMTTLGLLPYPFSPSRYSGRIPVNAAISPVVILGPGNVSAKSPERDSGTNTPTDLSEFHPPSSSSFASPSSFMNLSGKESPFSHGKSLSSYTTLPSSFSPSSSTSTSCEDVSDSFTDKISPQHQLCRGVMHDKDLSLETDMLDVETCQSKYNNYTRRRVNTVHGDQLLRKTGASYASAKCGLVSRLRRASESSALVKASKRDAGISSKMEAAMDLVKNHLILAVSEEMQQLTNRCSQLEEQLSLLRSQNNLLVHLLAKTDISQLELLPDYKQQLESLLDHSDISLPLTAQQSSIEADDSGKGGDGPTQDVPVRSLVPQNVALETAVASEATENRLHSSLSAS